MFEDQFDDQFEEVKEEVNYPTTNQYLCHYCKKREIKRNDGFCSAECSAMSPTRKDQSMEERIRDKTITGEIPKPTNGREYDTPCLMWIGAMSGNAKNKYPTIRIRGKAVNVSHITWAMHSEEPVGRRLIIHGCQEKLCVNPEHMFLGTASDAAKNWRSRSTIHNTSAE